MARPRSQLIVLESTPYYHCISRCVRRAFLCGKDDYTGQCFDHRKDWLIARIRYLGEVFAVNIAAYAVMSNHYHLVLHVDRPQALGWSREQVIHRWMRLYKGPLLAQRYMNQEQLSEPEMAMLDQVVEVWRERLYSLSWFMGRLNEAIARRANKEDQCKGRFWEGRFVSRGLVDESALLSCMAYVDLNPIRAGLAKDLTTADYTSIQQRLQEMDSSKKILYDRSKHAAHRQSKAQRNSSKTPLLPRLMPFVKQLHNNESYPPIAFNFQHYITLVERAGQAVTNGKRANPGRDISQPLAVLGITAKQWLTLSLKVHKQSINMLHGLNRLTAIEKQRGKLKKVA